VWTEVLLDEDPEEIRAKYGEGAESGTAEKSREFIERGSEVYV
jgi:hypothetical protein